MKERKKIHDNWKTPNYFLDDIEKEFGSFFDPCPLHASFDGLDPDCEWADVNYINPPYNVKDKTAFILRSIEESKKGKTCICLIPVSTSTKLFHDHIQPNAKEIRFIKGRIKFEGINSKGELVKNKCGMHDSMLVIFGK
jgi:hypothetical protein